MILGAIYAVFHFFLGILAAIWTARRMRRGGYTDGCLVFACAIVAFMFWPLALCVLIVDSVFDLFGDV